MNEKPPSPADAKSKLKFCKDCKFYEKVVLSTNSIWHDCIKNKKISYNLVTGKSQNFGILDCATARKDPDRCGEVGRWFEPK